MNDTVELDDSSLNSRRGSISFIRVLLVAVLALIFIIGGLVGAFYYFKGAFNFDDEREETKTTKTYAAAPDALGRYQIPEETPKKDETVEKELEAPQPEIITEEPSTAVTIQAAPEPTSDEPTLAERRYASDVSQYSQPNAPESVIPKRQVKVMRNVDYVLIKGTKIPCTLETNIVSEQAGFASCVINQDVYSSNARILLIEKGSKVTGQYDTELKNGERRLGVIWDRIITPYDVVVQLDSPSTGRLGQSGISGKVDNRWMTRIGSSLLVSIFDDALKIAGDRNESAQVVVDSSTADTSKDLANKILEKNIDLPPIVYIREGEMINIYVGDDIDMSSIYDIQGW